MKTRRTWAAIARKGAITPQSAERATAPTTIAGKRTLKRQARRAERKAARESVRLSRTEGDNEPTFVGDDVVKGGIFGWVYGDAANRYDDIDSDIGDALLEDDET